MKAAINGSDNLNTIPSSTFSGPRQELKQQQKYGKNLLSGGTKGKKETRTEKNEEKWDLARED